MLEDIKKISAEFEADLKGVQSAEQLQNLKIKYSGRKDGLVTKLFEQLKNLSVEQKREVGSPLNDLKKLVESSLLDKEQELLGKRAIEIDYTLPGSQFETGRLHPVTLVQKEITEVFRGMGFDVEDDGPEIDNDYYNFDSLGMLESHPARDSQDTFYLDLPLPKNEKGKRVVLRTQISNMQVRYMEKHKPPFAAVFPGRVYRNESTDASHEHTYQYLEGMMVGENLSFGNLAWTLDRAMKELFGHDVKTKFLPSYFPFVEPGSEMAISCLICRGKGCPVCKHTGWVEILGCGMIHQRVFQNAGYKKDQFTGFAWGMGLSRMALMKYRIPDIRLLAENDLRFLSQF